MGLTFAWDPRKAAANARKHRLTFEDAATVFGDRLALTIPDPDHSRKDDQRWITMGLSKLGALIVVIHSDQEDRVRIISARQATKSEQRTYEAW